MLSASRRSRWVMGAASVRAAGRRGHGRPCSPALLSERLCGSVCAAVRVVGITGRSSDLAGGWSGGRVSGGSAGDRPVDRSADRSGRDPTEDSCRADRTAMQVARVEPLASQSRPWPVRGQDARPAAPVRPSLRSRSAAHVRRENGRDRRRPASRHEQAPPRVPARIVRVELACGRRARRRSPSHSTRGAAAARATGEGGVGGRYPRRRCRR